MTVPIHSVIALTRDLDTPLTVAPLRHHLVSGDSLGDRFDIAVTRSGEAVPLTGAGVQAYFIRSADGYTIPITGSASGNVATVTLPEACYAVPGRFTLTVKAALGGVNHALWVGEGAVLRASTEALVDPDHTIPDVDELLAMIAQIEAAVNHAQTAAADATAAKQAADAATSAATAAAANAASAAQTAAPWGNVAATVTMLDASDSPTVTITDVSNGKRMAFRLPRGLTGLTPDLQIGTVATGEPGTSVVATITGTAEAPRLNLTIPRGDAGSIDSLTINGVHADSGTITLTPEDIGARPDTWMPTAADVGARPDTWMPTAADVGARPDTWMPTAADIGAVWKTGNILSLSTGSLSGHITTSSQRIRIGLNVGKPIEASRASISVLIGALRGVSGYLDGTGDSTDLLAQGYTVSASISDASSGNMLISIYKDSSFDNAVNNTPVALNAATLTIIFT